jgi:CBS domain-containing protein
MRRKELPVKTATIRMTVADAMHRGVVTCAVDTALSKVAQMMVGHRIHCVVVNSAAEQGAAPWGVVSDLDLAAAVARGEAEGSAAGEIAATPAVIVGMREPLSRAAQLMIENGVTHLVVVNPASGRPMGVLSTLDVARVLADS